MEAVHVQQSSPLNNEWTRFSSFINFPTDSVAMPMRLAQAGFYYTGFGEEAVCFCCGIKNGIWTEDESVLEVHRRLSQHCRYICGEDTTNIAIHGDNLIKPATKSAVRHSTLDKADYVAHRCESSMQTVKQQNELGTNLCMSGKSKQTAIQTNTHQFYGLTVPLTNGQMEVYPGITVQRPKHPDYALIRERKASYTEWSAQYIIDTTVLAKAGFYFAGLKDCVRCFFCSGGLRNWQNGDDPWIEHARWFPDCAYVKLCKGEMFVNICHATTIENDVVSLDNELDQENIPEDWLIESINSAIAKLMISKGYRQDDIEQALLFVRQKYGPTELKLEYMLKANLQCPTHEVSAAEKDNILDYLNQSCQERKEEEMKHKSANTARNATEFICQKRIENSKNKSEKQKLLEENRKLKDLLTCKICFDNDACVAFLPCGHLTTCAECSKSLRICAICRTVVQGTVRVYQA